MLEKFFIKDYTQTEDAEVRNKYGHLAGFIGIFTNLVLGGFKLFVGLVSNSVSIMADAVNNISDMATSALTIVGFKLTAKKPNHDHPYGYARYEYVCGFVISLFMLVMGVIFAKESIGKIIHPEELSIDVSTYIILGFGVLLKAFQMSEYRNIAGKINSNAVSATAIDTRNDIISSSGILLSMLIMGIFKINIDGYVGLAVSAFVIASSIGAVKEELEPIIGIIPTEEQVKMISDKLLSYPAVLGIHDMVIHNYGVNNDFVTVHCEVDSSGDICEIHDAMDIIENDFLQEFGILLTIHMDPILIGDLRLENIKDQIHKALNELDERLTFHDVRMVDGPTHTNIIFDCVVPQDKDYDKNFFPKYLKDRVSYEGCNLLFVVEVDRPYC